LLLQNFCNDDVLSYVFWPMCDAIEHKYGLHSKHKLTFRCYFIVHRESKNETLCSCP